MTRAKSRTVLGLILLLGTSLPSVRAQGGPPADAAALRAALAQAATPEARTALLDGSPGLVDAGLATALIADGDTSTAARAYPAAVNAYESAVLVSGRLGDRAGAALATSKLADMYRRRLKARDALAFYRASLEIYTTLDDRREIARVQFGVASCLWTLLEGDYMGELEKSARLAEQAGLPIYAASSYRNIATAYVQESEIDRALPVLAKAMALAAPLEDRRPLMNTFLTYGDAYFYRGDYVRSIDAFHEALTIARTVANPVGIALALEGLGLACKSQGSFQLSIRYFEEALADPFVLEHAGSAVMMFDNLGDAYLDLGDLDRAREYYEKGRVAAGSTDVGIELDWGTWKNLGDLADAEGDVNEALRQYVKAETLLQKESGAFADAQRAGIAFSISNCHYALKDFAAALDYARRPLATPAATDTSMTWVSHLYAGRALVGLGRYDEARRELESSIAALEGGLSRVAGDEATHARFRAVRSLPYFEMVSLLHRTGRAEEAFACSERARASVIVDVLERGRADISKVMTAAERDEQARLRSIAAAANRTRANLESEGAPVAEAQRHVDEARLAFEAFQTKVFAAHSDLAIQHGRSPAASVAQVRSILPPGGVAVEFASGKRTTFAFVVTASTFRMVDLGVSAKDLASQVEAFRGQLATRDLSFQALARQLDTELLGPLAAELKTARSIVFVPDGPLWDLPFEALQPRDGAYRVEQCAIAYAPSMTALRDMTHSTRRPAAKGNTLLALGNPAFRSASVRAVSGVQLADPLAPLPQAERQVEALSSLYGRGQSTILTGAAATEARAKSDAGRYRIVHFAAHGVLNDASPMYSSIVLAPDAGDKEDGLLEAWELLRLDLNADLIIFSACETARGSIAPGEGVLGLAWAAFVAGCPSTVVSQWKVDADSTTELMVAFHRQLQTARQPPAEALRTAELSLLRKAGGQYRHPYYWAAFRVVGKGFRVP